MKKTLLILDDQFQYGRSLERAFRRDYELVVATSVEEAKGCLADKIDLVLSDVRLDQSDPADRQGIGFVAWIRRQKPGIPIILMSAVDDPSLERDALAAGANIFLRKPIVVSRLRDVLQTLTHLQ